MKAVLLDGSRAGELVGSRVRSAMIDELRQAGWDVEHVLLREKKIGNCAGDFFCWIRSPGMCHVDDDNRAIAASIMQSDLTIYLTPITFGGYSSHLKSMVDHQIQNIAPHFRRIHGETHHKMRYAKYPDFLAVGYSESADERAEAIFRHLAWRNAINMCAMSAVTGIVHASRSDEEMRDLARGWLQAIARGDCVEPAGLPAALPVSESVGSSPIERALLLVGSPRTRTSTSVSLGGFLLEELEQKGIETETIFIHTILRSPEKMQTLYEAVDRSDLVVLAFPLYVDSLPAPLIEALERIARHRSASREGAGRAGSARQSFVAIANCGFPEAHHNNTALAICEGFARSAGLVPAGSLALGGGERLARGVRLRDARGPAVRVKESLMLAATSLADGRPVPEQAIAMLARQFIPAWLYRFVGDLFWRIQAKKYGMQNALDRRPYLPGA